MKTLDGLKKDLAAARASARGLRTAAETAKAKLTSSEGSWRERCSGQGSCRSQCSVVILFLQFSALLIRTSQLPRTLTTERHIASTP